LCRAAVAWALLFSRHDASKDRRVSERPWWQSGALYQLLVPSFLDTDGDGLGDLEGIVARLDYLEWLGVNAIWLSPCFPSPLKELGYDVSDYCNIEPRFGSLKVFDRLLDEAHRRDLRVILDWVGNHTSAQHPWFRDARSSRKSQRRNWYLWHDARPDGSPPNNWVSVFGGSVWQWDAATAQYYLHTFLDSQPDLNWREPAVRAAMLDAMKFWLDRGVDGFRLDAAPLFFKDPEWRDNPPNPDYRPGDLPDSTLLPRHTRNQPGLHELFAELRALVDGYAGDRVLLGEFYLPFDELATFYGADAPELHLPLNLSLTWSKWDAATIAKTIEDYQASVEPRGWPTTTLDTHDQHRIVARAGIEQARVATMLLLTQRGTPTLYYGDEIGMRGVDIPAEQAVDPQGRRTGRNRDPTRTPMQWSGDQHAGFSMVEPWLPVGVDRQVANVATQSRDAGSLLTLTRRLLELRNGDAVLREGSQEPLAAGPSLVAYRRRGSARELLVVLNFAHAPEALRLPGEAGRVLLSTFLDRQNERIEGQVRLRADEGVVVALDAPSAASSAA
jgi:alpha-glucosidase